MPILGVIASGISGHLTNPAFDSISTSTLGTAAASISFSSIPTTYSHLQIRGLGRSSAAAELQDIRIQFNGDTAANYMLHRVGSQGGASATHNYLGSTGVTYTYPGLPLPSAGQTAAIWGSAIIDIPDYKSANKNKSIKTFGGYSTLNVSGNNYSYFGAGTWLNTAAITSILLYPSSGNFTAGTTYALYGIKGA